MKNTEKMAECLVDQLMIKPDRAFDEFVSALRDTGQHHVANLLDFRSKEGSYFISAYNYNCNFSSFKPTHNPLDYVSKQ